MTHQYRYPKSRQFICTEQTESDFRACQTILGTKGWTHTITKLLWLAAHEADYKPARLEIRGKVKAGGSTKHKDEVNE